MNTHSYRKTRLLVSLVGLLLIVPPLHADDEGRTTPAPGYRPENENAADSQPAASQELTEKAGDGIRTHDVQLGKLAFYH